MASAPFNKNPWSAICLWGTGIFDYRSRRVTEKYVKRVETVLETIRSAMNIQHSIEALRILALSDEAKLRFVPGLDGWRCSASDGGGEIAFPAEAMLRALLPQLENLRGQKASDETINEIKSVIFMMLDLSQLIDYHWLLDKKKHPVTGPYDDGWRVLRRLAAIALDQLEIAESAPKLSFDELMKSAGLKIG
jgi:hypothetical protein